MEAKVIKAIAAMKNEDKTGISVRLPPEIGYKTPTAELAAGQTDEGNSAHHKELDQVLENWIGNRSTPGAECLPDL